jgi:hypothetical protein
MGLRDLPSALSITWLVLVLPTTCESMFLSQASFASAWRRFANGGCSLRAYWS